MENNFVQIIIPAAGKGQRFVDAGFTIPKPFIKIQDGRTLLDLALSAFNVNLSHTHIIIHENNRSFVNDKSVNYYYVAETTSGPATTCNLVRDRINPELPLLIANSDQFIRYSNLDITLANHCNNHNAHGCILTFYQINDKKWSYVRLNSNGFVEEIQEKNPISTDATVGVYYFDRAKYFFDSYDEMVNCNDRVNNEFYVGPVYNYMIKRNMRVNTLKFDNELIIPLGTPEDYYRVCENTELFYK